MTPRTQFAAKFPCRDHRRRRMSADGDAFSILTYNFRPTVIAISKSAEMSDKLELLDAGADDFLSESMPNREFQARLNAHIRRHIESLTNPLTGFLNEKLTRKTIKQIA